MYVAKVGFELGSVTQRSQALYLVVKGMLLEQRRGGVPQGRSQV